MSFAHNGTKIVAKNIPTKCKPLVFRPWSARLCDQAAKVRICAKLCSLAQKASLKWNIVEGCWR
jgi:hypothetical protein